MATWEAQEWWQMLNWKLGNLGSRSTSIWLCCPQMGLCTFWALPFPKGREWDARLLAPFSFWHCKIPRQLGLSLSRPRRVSTPVELVHKEHGGKVPGLERNEVMTNLTASLLPLSLGIVRNEEIPRDIKEIAFEKARSPFGSLGKRHLGVTLRRLFSKMKQ